MQMDMIFKIVDFLLDNDDYITADQLSNHFLLNRKAIMKLLKEIPEAISPCGMQLQIKMGSGYKILIDKDIPSHYEHYKIRMLHKNAYALPVSQQERTLYIAKKFLVAKSYIKTDDFIDELIISKSTLKVIMRDVKNLFCKNDLNISAIPHYGSVLIGDEFKIRLCFCRISHLPKTIELLSNSDIPKAELLNFISWFKELLYNNYFDFADDCFYYIVNYIFISIIRINTHHNLSNITFTQVDDEISGLSTKCLNYFSKFSIFFQETDSMQLSLLIYSLKNDKAIQAPFSSSLVKKLMDQIMDQINSKYTLNFDQDSELYKGLMQHLIPLEMRILLNFSLENPLKNEVYKEDKLAIEMSLLTANIIESFYKCKLTEDEVSYLTIHFALTLLKLKEKDYPKIILICPVAKGIQQMIKYRLLKSLHLEESQIKICSFYSLPSLNLTDYKCIVSTHRIPFEIDFPSIKIDYQPTETQEREINKYLHLQ